jgi:hypothetical protein
MGDTELETIRSQRGQGIPRGIALALSLGAAASAMGCEPEPRPPEVPANPPAEQTQADPSFAEQAGASAIAVDDFTEPLAHYGTWVDDPQYGRVWEPSDASAGPDFTPYVSDGMWVANDEGGWVFQSSHDASFGWATYHYGRWVELDGRWVWVPGTVWGPSWVEWRYGGGYVGWAPMGPPGAGIAERRWVFVEARRFTEPGVVAFRLPPERAHAAFVAAAPVVEMHGAANWTVGPPLSQLRAAGATVTMVHATPHGPGPYARATSLATPHVLPTPTPVRGVQPAPAPTAVRSQTPAVVPPKPKPKPLPVPPPLLPKPAPKHR